MAEGWSPEPSWSRNAVTSGAAASDLPHSASTPVADRRATTPVCQADVRHLL